jgi:hypothetical protein
MTASWAADAVRIHWFVASDEGQFSGAPRSDLYGGENFLDEFIWPADPGRASGWTSFGSRRHAPVPGMGRCPGLEPGALHASAPAAVADGLAPGAAQARAGRSARRRPRSPDPDAWYELLVDRADAHSDVWFDQLADALARVCTQVAGGADAEILRLSWEVREAETGVIAEGEALVTSGSHRRLALFSREVGDTRGARHRLG